MTEDQLEQETLAWLQDVGYAVRSGVDIAPDGQTAERATYREVLLLERLRQAIARLNPGIPAAAREDAVQRVQNLGLPAQLAAQRRRQDLQARQAQGRIRGAGGGRLAVQRGFFNSHAKAI